MRRFVLERMVDVSGISGTGIVAEGVVFSDGSAAVRWIAIEEHQSTTIWPSVDSLKAIHGHGGSTVIIYLDYAN